MDDREVNPARDTGRRYSIPDPQSLIRDPQSSILHPQSSTGAIRVNDLWKRYDAVEAVRGINLDVSQGEIFGLIGPDGAGKTTTFQILSGVMEATSGVVRVF